MTEISPSDDPPGANDTAESAVDPGMGERNHLDQWLRDLQVASSFWSWLPVGPVPPAKRSDVAHSRYLFPLAGLLLGVVPAFIFALAVWLHLGGAAAILAVVVLLLMTGGRAEIATASVVEALCRTQRREVRASVLGESRPGYYGVTALLFLFLLKVALLGVAESDWAGICILLAATSGSRGMIAIASWFADTLEGDRCGGLELEAGRNKVWVAATVTPLLLVLFLWFWSGLITIPVVMVVIAATFIAIREAFGGLPVYAIGLLQQVAEVTILATAVAYF